MTGTELQEVRQNAQVNFIDMIDIQQMEATVKKIATLRATIKKILVKKIDYDTIPGCGDKPTLLKPGAEKILIALGVTSEYVFLSKTEDHKGKGLFAYTVKCIVSHGGNKITEGLGSANSCETKWASKWVTEKQLPTEIDKTFLEKKEFSGQFGKYFKYKTDEDMNSKANTILKMAKKRAQVDATLAFAGLSEMFTQDIEDMSQDDIEPKRTNQQQTTPDYHQESNDDTYDRKISKEEQTKLKEAISPAEFARLMTENDNKIPFSIFKKRIDELKC